jgi:hypothetical protein
VQLERAVGDLDQPDVAELLERLDDVRRSVGPGAVDDDVAHRVGLAGFDHVDVPDRAAGGPDGGGYAAEASGSSFHFYA